MTSAVSVAKAAAGFRPLPDTDCRAGADRMNIAHGAEASRIAHRIDLRLRLWTRHRRPGRLRAAVRRLRRSVRGGVGVFGRAGFQIDRQGFDVSLRNVLAECCRDGRTAAIESVAHGINAVARLNAGQFQFAARNFTTFKGECRRRIFDLHTRPGKLSGGGGGNDGGGGGAENGKAFKGIHEILLLFEACTMTWF